MATEKGQTVQIAADTSKFDSAIKESNKIASILVKTMKELDAALKLDPNNVDLVEKKYKSLNAQIEQANIRLQALKNKQAEWDNDPNSDKQSANYKQVGIEIEQVTAKINKLSSEAASLMYKSDDGAEELADSIREVEKASEKADKSIIKLGDIITANLVSDFIISGIKTLANSLKDIAVNAVKYNMSLEKYTASLTAMLSGNEEAAKGIIDSMKKISSVSSFDLTSLLEANQLLVSTGMGAAESTASIEALTKAIAYTGGSNDELKRMASNLQQIKNYGKASATDIRQFAYAGIDIYGILSETTGKTVEELKEMAITYDMINEALIKAGDEGGKYFGALETQAGTLSGQTEQLKSNWQEMTGTIASSLTESLSKDFLPTLNNTIKDWKKMYEEHGIQGLEIAITEGIGRLIEKVSEKMPGLLEAGRKIIVAIVKGIIRELPTIAKNILLGIGEALLGIGESFVEFTRMGGQLIKGLAKGIKEGIADLVSNIGNLFSPVTAKIKGLFGIHSPSTVFRDEIGRYLMLGLAEGIEEGVPEAMGKVNNAMATLQNGIQASVNPVINPTANSNPIILNIENFNNTRATDIQALAEELEFYRKNSALAYGGE